MAGNNSIRKIVGLGHEGKISLMFFLPKQATSVRCQMSVLLRAEGGEIYVVNMSEEVSDIEQ